MIFNVNLVTKQIVKFYNNYPIEYSSTEFAATKTDIKDMELWKESLRDHVHSGTFTFNIGDTIRFNDKMYTVKNREVVFNEHGEELKRTVEKLLHHKLFMNRQINLLAEREAILSFNKKEYIDKFASEYNSNNLQYSLVFPTTWEEWVEDYEYYNHYHTLSEDIKKELSCRRLCTRY